ncbi:hypothetical protein ROHU_013290 [Labeo rohita]|uniref:Uncharacterized protein n=1 Tax=Labeo rohita TaxID=84645 RepID=A0A498LB31_LABRO|nr:hypothetical protein ROHU_013290 [Labeo rohita]
MEECSTTQPQASSKKDYGTLERGQTVGAPNKCLKPPSHEGHTYQKEWLKHNLEPFTQVQSYMKDTVLCRANWIRANSSKDILELLTEYPHLTSPGMIAQDVQVLHGEAAPKLLETWIPEYAEKVLYLAKQDNKLPSLSVEDMTLDAKGELALTLLPTMVPQVVYRVGKKTIRHSIEESRTAFIHQMPVKEGNPSDMFHVKAKG